MTYTPPPDPVSLLGERAVSLQKKIHELVFKPKAAEGDMIELKSLVAEWYSSAVQTAEQVVNPIDLASYFHAFRHSNNPPDAASRLDILTAFREAGTDFSVVPIYPPSLNLATYLTMNGYSESLKILKPLKIDFNQPSPDGTLPIMQAVQNFRKLRYKELGDEYYGDDLRMIPVLAELGADINAENQHGWTPLTYASYRDCGIAMMQLAVAGADFNKASKHGSAEFLAGRASMGSGEAGRVLEYLRIDERKISLEERNAQLNRFIEEALEAYKLG
jgi:hypothetical protein